MPAVIRRQDLVQSVADALQFISYYHPADYISHLAKAYELEQSPAARDAIAQILTNSRMCAEGRRPICQDTGIVNVFLKIGMDVRFEGFSGSLEDAVNEGVRRGYLGVSMSLNRQSDGGARILSVLPGSPADRAGIRPGDIIVGFDRSTVTTPRQLYALVAGASPGGRMDVQLLRGAIERIGTVELTEATVLPSVLENDRNRIPTFSEPLTLSPTTQTPVSSSTPR